MHNIINSLGLSIIRDYKFNRVIVGGGSACSCVYTNGDDDIFVKLLIAPRNNEERAVFKYEYELSEIVWPVSKQIKKPVFFDDTLWNGCVSVAAYQFHEGLLLGDVIKMLSYSTNPEGCVNLFHQTVTAVSRATATFIHRDLHPGNILITHSITNWQEIDRDQSGVLLLDLGSALFSAEGNSVIKGIHGKRLIGALQSTPPEVFKESYLHKNVYQFPQYDAWALGHILHKIMFGTVAYQITSIGALVDHFSSTEASFPRPPLGSSDFFIRYLLHKLLCHDWRARISPQDAARYLYQMRFTSLLTDNVSRLDDYVMKEGMDPHHGEPPHIESDYY